ncbi:MAG TPA: thiamine phosphate synthase [Gemmatimonadales bacterium]|nr:thiamine phosphate synthase [Gemmatimonadales bacterium]
MTTHRQSELPRLHAVTDERIARLADLADRSRALSSAGTVALHARGHSLSGRDHLTLAQLLRAAAPEHLFVNDRLDIALAVDATGVQLSTNGLSPAEARRLHPAWWIGMSVHTPEEAAAAQAGGADYLLVGPVFATPTHPERRPLGVEGLTRFTGLGLPVVAIGGISRANARDVVAAGAHGVAMIRALWDAHDPARAAQEIMKEIAWKSS